MEDISISATILPHGLSLPLPDYATQGASGMDIYAAADMPLKAGGGIACVPTGLCLELPAGYEAQIRPRSGLALKHGITVLNAPGTIDWDYRGEVKIILINFSDREFFIEKGMRIAQMVISPVVRAKWKVQDNLSISARGEEGFGSTGL